MSYHLPVMAKESIEALDLNPEGIYVDATYGGGGHSGLILDVLNDQGRLIAFDQDPDAAGNVVQDERLMFVPQNFRFLQRFLRLYGVKKVDGVLADLGVSSHQFDEGGRGFSYRFDAELDMRMNQNMGKTAAEVVNSYSVKALQSVFSRYGEVRNARSLAQQIVDERGIHPIKTTQDLLRVMESCIRGQRLRYLSQVFQALRIEVNDEMAVLEDFLPQTLTCLKPGGRLVVISYHSLEDRLVKNFLRSGHVDGQIEKDFYGHIYRPFEVLTKKAMVPSEGEIKENPRARSAKMRVGVLKDITDGKA
ncbi:MAG: 16S rRNA (cytosine(1402)-N(4))-methyltransferase RsmH [Saprospiraceae bacterium]|nr:16S rRNA (cytosine(1402)-N(4))-methyltransferase RsmH [Saprospiraceae bacterium]